MSNVEQTTGSTPVAVRPLQEKDVPQIVPLLAENYKTQEFRMEFFKHVILQPAPQFGLLLFGCVAFFCWKNVPLALLSPVLLYVYLAALYHFRVNSILASVPDLKDVMSYYMSQTRNCFWVAACGDEVAGSVGVRVVGEGVAEIKRMQVAASFRRRGLARKLLETAIDHCRRQAGVKEVVLSTTAMQLPATKMYTKYGFQFTRKETRNIGPLKIATMDLLHYKMQI